MLLILIVFYCFVFLQKLDYKIYELIKAFYNE